MIIAPSLRDVELDVQTLSIAELLPLRFSGTVGSIVPENRAVTRRAARSRACSGRGSRFGPTAPPTPLSEERGVSRAIVRDRRFRVRTGLAPQGAAVVLEERADRRCHAVATKISRASATRTPSSAFRIRRAKVTPRTSSRRASGDREAGARALLAPDCR